MARGEDKRSAVDPGADSSAAATTGDPFLDEVERLRLRQLADALFARDNELSELRNELHEQRREMIAAAEALRAAERTLDDERRRWADLMEHRARPLDEISRGLAERLRVLLGSRAWKLSAPLLSMLLEPGSLGRTPGLVKDIQVLLGQYDAWSTVDDAEGWLDAPGAVADEAPQPPAPAARPAAAPDAAGCLARLRGEAGPVFRLGLAVTETEESSGAGDLFTARELAAAVAAETGWETELLGRKGDGRHWYETDGLDAVLVLLQDFDLSRLGTDAGGVIKIAWVRNWVDRWAARPWFHQYDLVLCSSEKAADWVRRHTGVAARVLRIAANTDRFRPDLEPDPELASDYCFTGSFWGAPRTIEALDPGRMPYRFALYGRGWEGHDRFRDSHRGALPYDRMPTVYASSKILVDDANHATRPWASVNSRVFDALACGTLVLTSGVEGARETFGERLPSFDSIPELEAMLRHFLEHPDARETLARELQAEVRRAHSYACRAVELRELIADFARPKRRIALRWSAHADTGSPGAAACPWACEFAAELRGPRQSVRLLLPDAAHVPPAFPDDVLLTLGGPDIPAPGPAAANVLWLIRPVARDQLARCAAYERVLVASPALVAEMEEAGVTGAEYLPLSPPAEASAGPPPTPRGSGVLFVGDAHGAPAALLTEAIDAGLEPVVVGAGWNALIDPSRVVAEALDGPSLRRLFRRCGAVLCGHSAAMREQGFVSRHLPEALASGAVVVSEAVPGLAEEFGSAVMVWSGRAGELRPALEPALAAGRSAGTDGAGTTGAESLPEDRRPGACARRLHELFDALGGPDPS